MFKIYFLLDEGPSPSTQPCQDRTACDFNKPIVSSSSVVPITPSKTARNLEVVIDDQLNFSDHMVKTTRSCKFALYNICKIRPFLSEHDSQLLAQALILSRLEYCNALLASSIKPLQLIHNTQNARQTSVHQFALANNSCSHKIQEIDVCLQKQLWLCTPLHKFTTSDICAL